MAITYHAGRTIQGLSETTTTVTTSKITNTNGSNNSNGFSQITGKIGNALQQSGGGNYNLGSTIILNPSATNGWSVNMWVKVPTPSGNQYWLQYNTDQASYNRSIFYMYKHSTDGLVPSFYDGTGQRLNVDTGGTTLTVASSEFNNDGSWHMVTFTWNNTDKKYRVYVDGVVKLTSKAHTHTNAGQWTTPLTGYTLGNYDGGTGGSYDSEAGFDEWSFWKDTLSQADIDELYNSGNAIAATALSNATAISKLAVYYDWEDAANGTLTNQCPTTVNVTSPLTKPTNVQAGSRFEETDTRKMYRYEDTLSVTQDFDSNTGHTVNQTTVNGWYAEIYNKIAYDGTNNRLSFTCHDPTNWGASFDLQQSANGGFGSAISNTKWVLRFKWYILTNSGSTSNGAQGALGISSVPATTISGMDFMGLSLRQHASSGEVGLFNATIDNNNPMNQGQSAKKFVTGNLSTSTAYFVEIIRNGDVCTTTIGTNSYGGTTNGGTLDRTVTSISGLRYLYFKAQQDSATATHTSYVDDIKFYNGVTATGNAWSEEGT